MNKNSDIANAVVNEQVNRLLEREKEGLGCLLIPLSGQEPPSFIRELMFDIALRAAVMMKISATARLN